MNERIDFKSMICPKCGHKNPSVKWYNKRDKLFVNNVYMTLKTERFVLHCNTCEYKWFIDVPKKE